MSWIKDFKALFKREERCLIISVDSNDADALDALAKQISKLYKDPFLVTNQKIVEITEIK